MKKTAGYWTVEICLLVNAIVSMIVVGRGVILFINMFTAEHFSINYFMATIYFFISNCLQMLCLMIGFCYWIKVCITSDKAAMNILKCGIWGTIAYMVSAITVVIFAGQIYISFYILSPVCIVAIGLLCKYKGDHMKYDPLFTHISNLLKRKNADS